MIFKLTKEEEAKSNELIKAREEALKKGNIDEVNEAYSNYELYMRSLEYDRFSKLKSKEEIIESAKEQIDVIYDYLPFGIGNVRGVKSIYNFLTLEGEKEEDIIEFLLAAYDYHLSMYRKELQEEKEILDELNAKIKEQLQSLNSINLPSISSKISNTIIYPLDKVNNTLWYLPPEKQHEIIPFNMLSKDSEEVAELTIFLDFSELENEKNIEISSELTAYDKKVYNAIGTLYITGNEIISLRQIYKQMRKKGKPGKNDKKKILNSIYKMARTQIKIVDTQEDIRKNRKTRIYEDSLLPSKRYTALTNGQLTEYAIKISDEPLLYHIALIRNQITTVKNEVLDVPLSDTEANLELSDYLLQYIARNKHVKNKKECVVIIDNLFKKLEITDRRIKKRTLEKISKILNHFMKTKYIKKFNIGNEKITISI